MTVDDYVVFLQALLNQIAPTEPVNVVASYVILLNHRMAPHFNLEQRLTALGRACFKAKWPTSRFADLLAELSQAMPLPRADAAAAAPTTVEPQKAEAEGSTEAEVSVASKEKKKKGKKADSAEAAPTLTLDEVVLACAREIVTPEMPAMLGAVVSAVRMMKAAPDGFQEKDHATQTQLVFDCFMRLAAQGLGKVDERPRPSKPSEIVKVFIPAPKA